RLPAGLGGFQVGALGGGEPGGLLDHRGQVGALGDGEVADVLAEVGAGGGLHAVGAAAEVDRVEVLLQRPVLRLGLVDLDRDHDLFGLADDRALLAEADVVVADELLGDGGAALELPPGDGGPDGAGGALDGDAAVFVEGAVFGGDDGRADVLGHLVQLDVAAVDALPGDDGLAVA